MERILGLDREVLPQEIPHPTLLEWRIRAERSRNRRVLDGIDGRLVGSSGPLKSDSSFMGWGQPRG